MDEAPDELVAYLTNTSRVPVENTAAFRKRAAYWVKALFGAKVRTATDTNSVEDRVRAAAYRVDRSHRGGRMTLQNRVTPFGEIVAVPEHGTLMGNRGCLHDDERRLVRMSARVAWVTCRLAWKEIRRTIMTPGKYTELFFLDEATALAAGHRPCGDCRAERLVEFERAWAAGVEGRPGAMALVSRIDPVMKRDRSERDGVQRRFTARAGGLPDGVMVHLPGEEGIARLKWRGQYLKWSPAGYRQPKAVDEKTTVTVLTPACTVKVIAAGYVPEVHRSAG